jgi:hypothetical protein
MLSVRPKRKNLYICTARVSEEVAATTTLHFCASKGSIDVDYDSLWEVKAE